MSEHERIVEHLPSLRRFARALVGGADDADDLVQDCIARAIDRWHLWDSERPLRPWLFTIMRNLFISGRRRAARRPMAVELPENAAELSVRAGQDGAVFLVELARALADLPDEQREVVLLVGLEGFSYAEAADIIDVPVGTVMSRLSRGRERLRRRLETGEGPVIRRVK